MHGSCSGAIKERSHESFCCGRKWSDRSAVDRGTDSQGTHSNGNDELRIWSEETASDGVEVAIANAFDNDAVEAALRASDAEAVIDELTSIPKTPSELPAYAARDHKLRIEGGGNLHRAALLAAYAVTSSSRVDSFLTRMVRWRIKNSPLAVNASSSIAGYAQMYADLEQAGTGVVDGGSRFAVRIFLWAELLVCTGWGGTAEQVRSSSFR